MPAIESQTEIAAEGTPADRTTCVLTHPRLQLGLSLAVLVGAVWWVQLASSRVHSKTSERSRVSSSKLSIGLNSAEARELSLLPGIGPKLSDRVVQHRETQGPFESIEDLLAVHGVGPKVLQSLRPWVHVSFQDSNVTDSSDGFRSQRNSASFDDAWPVRQSEREDDRFDDFGGGGHDGRLVRVASGRLSD